MTDFVFLERGYSVFSVKDAKKKFIVLDIYTVDIKTNQLKPIISKLKSIDYYKYWWWAVKQLEEIIWHKLKKMFKKEIKNKEIDWFNVVDVEILSETHIVVSVDLLKEVK